MAEQYKSVLEKYNESLKRRLPTAEEEAIEPVYPEEYLVGGPGKAVASGFMKSGKQAAKTATRPSAQIGTKVKDIEAEKATAEAFAKTKWGKATNEYSKKQAEQAAKQQAKADFSEAAENAAIQGANRLYGNVGWDAGADMAEARRNVAGDTYKKGGMTASRRGDGIAARGKTRGRFV